MKRQKKSTARSTQSAGKISRRRSKSTKSEAAQNVQPLNPARGQAAETERAEMEVTEMERGLRSGGTQRLPDPDEASPETVRGFPEDGEETETSSLEGGEFAESGTEPEEDEAATSPARRGRRRRVD